MMPGMQPGMHPGMHGALVPVSAVMPGGPGMMPPHTAEGIPVGLMASVTRVIARRNREMHAPYVPYRPIDPSMVPPQIPPFDPNLVTVDLRAKVEACYAAMESAEEEASAKERLRTRSRSRSAGG